ncbi:MAG: hypothetical protein SPJ27_02615 [Candidatus Onthovivens sp.]|nr:hypothetical protein [Candidatus Onthovivens sp.]
MIIENLTTLKINQLTQAQYEREKNAGRLDETALYLTPDDGAGIPTKISELENDSGFITGVKVTESNDGNGNITIRIGG